MTTPLIHDIKFFYFKIFFQIIDPTVINVALPKLRGYEVDKFYKYLKGKGSK